MLHPKLTSAQKREQSERSEIPALSPQDLVALARQLMQAHPHFHHRLNSIHIQCNGQRLELTGRLPSFHLKQVAQEALSKLPVVIDNQIDVVSCNGLSSSGHDAGSSAALPLRPR